jgi:hypothetical protein
MIKIYFTVLMALGTQLLLAQSGFSGGICSSIFCDGSGGVGINTQKTNGFALSVNGKIRASDIIKVYPQSQWADFVFEKSYKLPALMEVEKYIKANGHLPGIPSAEQVEKEGVALGDLNAKLLQKIEELTLYLIDFKKTNDKWSNANQELEKELSQMKEQLHLLAEANQSSPDKVK